MRFHGFALIAVSAAVFSGCAALTQKTHEAQKRLTGIECRPTGATLEQTDQRAAAAGNGRYLLMCTDGMLLQSERLESKWLSKEEVAAAHLEIRQLEQARLRERKAAADETARQMESMRAAEEASRPQPPAGKDICKSPLVAYLTYHDGCSKPGMEANPIADGCVALLDDRLKTIQKVTGGYLITGNRDWFPSDPMMCPLAFDVAFLETDSDISRGGAPSGYAEYLGRASYTALDGFSKSVLKFREVPSRH